MPDIISRLLDEAEKAQRKGHLLLGEVCRDASDRIGLLEHEIDRLRAALRQFADCELHDGNCASLDVAAKRIRAIARAALGENRND